MVILPSFSRDDYGIVGMTTGEKVMKYLAFAIALLLMSPGLSADTEVLIKRGNSYHIVITDCQVGTVEKVRAAKIKAREPIELVTADRKVVCKIKKVQKLEVA